MAKNLMSKIRKHRVAVPMRFTETVKDGKGRELIRENIYSVYMSSYDARKINPAVEYYYEATGAAHVS